MIYKTQLIHKNAPAHMHKLHIEIQAHEVKKKAEWVRN